jgi:hypothetical protein
MGLSLPVLVLHSAFGLLTINSQLTTSAGTASDFHTVKWKEWSGGFTHAEGVYAEQLGHAGYRALLDET